LLKRAIEPIQRGHQRMVKSHIWRVEYVRQDPERSYPLNKSMVVISETISQAIDAVLIEYPEAKIIKAFKGENWGNDGVLIVGDIEWSEDLAQHRMGKAL
jgi:hypothetical protein